MLNILVYALPVKSDGGNSVVFNLYEDIKAHKEIYPDVKWYFITNRDGYEDTENITVFNESRVLKTYFHRLFFNVIKLKRFIKKYDIKAIISLNMCATALKTPSIISFHNVLPLYHCGSEVFDSKYEMIKQAIINRIIVWSLKRAEYIIIPSNWIKRKLVSAFGIASNRIFISPITLPEIVDLRNRQNDKNNKKEKNDIIQFIYPSSGYPYKNHRVIVGAVNKLRNEGINNFCVRFAGNVGQGKTIMELREKIKQLELPIEFCGLLSKEELVKSYINGILLFPSKIETDAFPLLESMACGGYIIASDLDYAREALKNYDNYDLFEPDDIDALAEYMRKAVLSQNIKRGKTPEVGDTFSRTEVIVPLLRKIAVEG